MIETIPYLSLDVPDGVEKIGFNDECLELERVIKMFFYFNLNALNDWKEFYPEIKSAQSGYPESEHPRIYKRNDDEHYSAKGCHKERTLGNEKNRSGGHKEHWKKEKRKKFSKTLAKNRN